MTTLGGELKSKFKKGLPPPSKSLLLRFLDPIMSSITERGEKKQKIRLSLIMS